MICPRDGRMFETGLATRGLELEADLTVPRQASGLVLVAQARGHRSPSPLPRALSEGLRPRRVATCCVDLIDPSEQYSRVRVRDIDLLAERLERVMDYLAVHPATWRLPVAFVGIGAAAPAALTLAAERPNEVRAAVCCFGRPDLARADFAGIQVPILLLAPATDSALLQSHENVFLRLQCPSRLAVLRGTTGIAERGSLAAADHAIRTWCTEHLLKSTRQTARADG